MHVKVMVTIVITRDNLGQVQLATAGISLCDYTG